MEANKVLTDEFISVPILDFYAGGYKLFYDGKYISLIGRDKNYKGFGLDANGNEWYEEMVLIPVVDEVRNANPSIVNVSNIEITIALNII